MVMFWSIFVLAYFQGRGGHIPMPKSCGLSYMFDLSKKNSYEDNRCVLVTSEFDTVLHFFKFTSATSFVHYELLF
jgi:hypothetical protein